MHDARTAPRRSGAVRRLRPGAAAAQAAKFDGNIARAVSSSNVVLNDRSVGKRDVDAMDQDYREQFLVLNRKKPEGGFTEQTVEEVKRRREELLARLREKRRGL